MEDDIVLSGRMNMHEWISRPTQGRESATKYDRGGGEKEDRGEIPNDLSNKSSNDSVDTAMFEAL